MISEHSDTDFVIYKVYWMGISDGEVYGYYKTQDVAEAVANELNQITDGTYCYVMKIPVHSTALILSGKITNKCPACGSTNFGGWHNHLGQVLCPDCKAVFTYEKDEFGCPVKCGTP